MSRPFCQFLSQGWPSLLLPSTSRFAARNTQCISNLPLGSRPSAPSRLISTRPRTTSKPSRSPVSRAPSTPPKKSPDELAGLAYVIHRTSYIQLPVYRRFMSGGNRQVVLIKQVGGDRRKLLEDLVEGLGIERDNIRINPTTQHVELKVYSIPFSLSSTPVCSPLPQIRPNRIALGRCLRAYSILVIGAWVLANIETMHMSSKQVRLRPR